MGKDLLNQEVVSLNGILEGGHHALHTLPYVGSTYGAAHMMKHAAVKIGESTAASLNLSERTQAIIDAVESLADWVLDSAAFGTLGHLAGDLPNKGDSGFSALRLLKPLSQQNFSFGWMRHNAQPWNSYLQTAGLAIAGASWSVAGLYLASWQPPETRLLTYMNELRTCESYSEMQRQVVDDIEHLFTYLLGTTTETFWNLPLFESTSTEIRDAPADHWYRMTYSLEELLGVKTADYETLYEIGVLPPAFPAPGDGIPLQQPIEHTHDETPLFTDESSSNESLRSEINPESIDSLTRDTRTDTDDLSTPTKDTFSLTDAEHADGTELRDSQETESETDT